MSDKTISSPEDEQLDELCSLLAERCASLDQTGDWPHEQLRLCGEYGVYQWFIPVEFGGQDWSELDVVRGYLKLSAACLTTTFILTQRVAACRRIVLSKNESVKLQLLPALARGDLFTTVGISHLTTSRRHLKTPVLQAEEIPSGFRLNGFSPWVTGGKHADTIVTGANLPDGRQVLFAMPTHLDGVSVPSPVNLVGLMSSHTGEVRMQNVEIPAEYLLAGPAENVMAESGTRTGGLQTSTLAIGLARAAISFVGQQAQQRPELQEPYKALQEDHHELIADLEALASGNEVCSTESLRTRANSIALRSSQAALAAAKGSGYVIGHPAGRWCREALFFLVWSCPQPVVNANLCELAGLSD